MGFVYNIWADTQKVSAFIKSWIELLFCDRSPQAKYLAINKRGFGFSIFTMSFVRMIFLIKR